MFLFFYLFVFLFCFFWGGVASDRISQRCTNLTKSILSCASYRSMRNRKISRGLLTDAAGDIGRWLLLIIYVLKLFQHCFKWPTLIKPTDHIILPDIIIISIIIIIHMTGCSRRATDQLPSYFSVACQLMSCLVHSVTLLTHFTSACLFLRYFKAVSCRMAVERLFRFWHKIWSNSFKIKINSSPSRTSSPGRKTPWS